MNINSENLSSYNYRIELDPKYNENLVLNSQMLMRDIESKRYFLDS